MKLRFDSFDIVCGVTELQSLVGLRVNQIYDIDNKTYLLRLQGGGDTKKVLLIESGIRFHTTAFEWQKNLSPSGFTMKLRKHLKNKRLENMKQLGIDRIVDFQFGSGEAAYHIIVELYDRGNIILTDHEMTILHILRPHREGEYTRFAVREKYALDYVKKELPLPRDIDMACAIKTARPGSSLKSILMSVVPCGSAVIEHILIKHNLDTCIISKNEAAVEISNIKAKKSKKNVHFQLNSRDFDMENDMEALMAAVNDIIKTIEEAKNVVSKGFIVQNKQEKPCLDGKDIEYFFQNVEFHPYNFSQYQGQPIAEFETFMLAVDEFYSSLEGQKVDVKTLQQEKEALKKLSNVKRDHVKRIENLNTLQDTDKRKAELITINQGLVDNAILAIRSAVANQMSWPDIHELVKAAQVNGDPVAGAIVQLKLEINHISLRLSDPYDASTEDINESDNSSNQVWTVDVDLALTAWANARKYYDQKRSAAQKEQKTIDASQKALKSAERKTQQTLKDIRTISTISKARKVYWFEKFYWFISSENYLVIAGRDAQQNEIIVKRYMRPNDVYVHAEIHGASSVIIRNPNAGDIPPKTLLEAGTMAISYSIAWDAKVVTSAYWVRSEQVSKTAPTGEYLGTGSFMIRGKKNFLPSCTLVMGVSLLFKLDDSFIEKHLGERKVRRFEDEQERAVENEMKTLSLKDEVYNDIVVDKDNLEKENETNNEIVPEYCETEVKVEHNTEGISVNMKTSSTTEVLVKSELSKNEPKTSVTVNQEETTIIPAVPTRKKQQQNSKKSKERKDRKSQITTNQAVQKHVSTNEGESKNKSEAVKRGQKGKLKKIKAKYRDQDEEERQLRMLILKSAGTIDDVTTNTNANTNTKEVTEDAAIKENNVSFPSHQKQNDKGDEENTYGVPESDDLEIINSLTGQPFDEDELLFAIPVVAPYQALQNYKYKLKVIPGTGKRGRAAKQAISTFLSDKLCSLKEKGLVKSVRDEGLARNLPGKVKLSLPQVKK